jgi:hypothetical protein
MLKSRECVVCHESHVLRPDGRMSIHQNARGERCEEPDTRTAVDDARSERHAQKREAARPRRQVAEDVPSELDEAFGVAADKRHKRDDRPPRGLNKGIYVTGRPSFLNGGSPGHGKRS